MEGFGVHTYKLINREGKQIYCKWRWKPSCGLKFLLEDEAAVVGGKNHSQASKDLYDSIASGDYPEWTLCIQTMEIQQEDQLDFDPLDDPKSWPENLFPPQVSPCRCVPLVP